MLKIENLNKHFSNTKALDDVNLQIMRGSITGLLGPNGAGKTTLLRIINGIIASDSGKVLIDGKEASLETAQQIGYMPEERGLYANMRVDEQILYFGLLKGGDEKRVREVMKEYLEIFNLKGEEKRKIKELSKGNQQKVQIISTIVHEPKLVIFDEPFSGFDPINGALLGELLERLHNKGVTIILSSHNMPAVEEICKNIILINKGKILISQNIYDIKEENKTGEIIFTTRSPLSTQILMDSGKFKTVKAFDTAKNRKGYAYLAEKESGVSNNDLFDSIAVQSEILHFEENLPSLNDIFIKYTKKQ